MGTYHVKAEFDLHVDDEEVVAAVCRAFLFEVGLRDVQDGSKPQLDTEEMMGDPVARGAVLAAAIIGAGVGRFDMTSSNLSASGTPVD